MDLTVKSRNKIDNRFFVGSDFIADLTCPGCGKSQRYDVSKYFNHGAQVKTKCKCSCQHTFSAILEKRQSAREEKSIQGHTNKTKWVIKKEKKQHTIYLLPMFFLIIVLLVLAFDLIIDSGAPAKLSPMTDQFTSMFNGNEIKSVYDISK